MENTFDNKIDYNEVIPTFMKKRFEHETLNKKEERFLFKQQDFDTIFEHNQLLCLSVAKKFSGRKVPIEDRINEAGSVLWKCILKHDPQKSRIATHAVPQMERSLSVLCRNYNSAFDFAPHLITYVNRLHFLVDDLESALRRSPTKSEVISTERFKKIKQESGLSVENLWTLFTSQLKDKVSIYDKVDDELLVLDTIQSEHNAVDKVELDNLIDYYLKPLDKVEEQVFRLRFLIGLSQKKVCDRVKLKATAVRKKEKSAKRKVYEHILSDDFLFSRVKSKVRGF